MKKPPYVLMAIESSRESGRQLISGIADYARQFGPWRFDWRPESLHGVAATLAEGKYHGALTRDVADVASLTDAGIPVVAFTYSKQSAKGVCWVDTDDAAIGKVVATHFLSLGFRHFAFIGYEEMPWSVARARGFVSEVGTAGFEARQLLTSANGLNDAAFRVKKWLNTLPQPVALMAADDDLGQWVIQQCMEEGLRIPDDCRVCGVDNDPVVCGISFPPLSSVSINRRNT